MTLIECYEKLHGNYDEAKKRLMTEKIITKFILKFPADPTMDQLTKAIESGNSEEAFRAAHTLKGVASNLAFTALHEAASELTEDLRKADGQTSQELVEKVEESYKNVIDALAEYKSGL